MHNRGTKAEQIHVTTATAPLSPSTITAPSRPTFLPVIVNAENFHQTVREFNNRKRWEFPSKFTRNTRKYLASV